MAISFVVKANNRGDAIKQRDSFNAVMNEAMKDDGSFDIDWILRNHHTEFFMLIKLVNYRITHVPYSVTSCAGCIKAAKKYEDTFLQLEQPIFEAIKRAVESEERFTALVGSDTIKFFCERAYLSDLPERLKHNAIESAKKAAGDDFDLTTFLNDQISLSVLLGQGIRSPYFFNLNSFEYSR